MYWNHRIVNIGKEQEDGEDWLAICEVFYNDNNQPVGYTEVAVSGETLKEVQKELERMKSAFGHPVLNPSDFYPTTVN